MTITKDDDDCYTVKFKRLQMMIGIVGFLLLVFTPIASALMTWAKTDMRMTTFITREEVAQGYISRRAADDLTEQRNLQMAALNQNIVAIASNQDSLNGNLNRLMGKLGVEAAGAMRPIPHAVLPLARNPEPEVTP